MKRELSSKYGQEILYHLVLLITALILKPLYSIDLCLNFTEKKEIL